MLWRTLTSQLLANMPVSSANLKPLAGSSTFTSRSTIIGSTLVPSKKSLMNKLKRSPDSGFPYMTPCNIVNFSESLPLILTAALNEAQFSDKFHEGLRNSVRVVLISRVEHQWGLDQTIFLCQGRGIGSPFF
jgi:hypothetical protein